MRIVHAIHEFQRRTHGHVWTAALAFWIGFGVCCLAKRNDDSPTIHHLPANSEAASEPGRILVPVHPAAEPAVRAYVATIEKGL